MDPATGALTELFDADWRPAAGDAGRVLDPGHHFEWAWLLEQWSWVSGRQEGAEVARRLFEAGERGVDPARGAVMDCLNADFSARERTARLWPQTERLRAALLLASSAEGEARERYVANALDAAQGFAPYLQTPVAGLWRDKLRADGEFVDEPAPASSFYHIMGALLELRAQAPTLA